MYLCYCNQAEMISGVFVQKDLISLFSSTLNQLFSNSIPRKKSSSLHKGTFKEHENQCYEKWTYYIKQT